MIYGMYGIQFDEYKYRQTTLDYVKNCFDRIRLDWTRLTDRFDRLHGVAGVVDRQVDRQIDRQISSQTDRRVMLG